MLQAITMVCIFIGLGTSAWAHAIPAPDNISLVTAPAAVLPDAVLTAHATAAPPEAGAATAYVTTDHHYELDWAASTTSTVSTVISTATALLSTNNTARTTAAGLNITDTVKAVSPNPAYSTNGTGTRHQFAGTNTTGDPARCPATLSG